jgi:hypothetical protein
MLQIVEDLTKPAETEVMQVVLYASLKSGLH